MQDTLITETRNGSDVVKGASSTGIIMLMGIAVVGYKANGVLRFRAQVQSIAEDRSISLQQTTQARTQPDWLVRYAHPLGCTLLVTISTQQGQDGWIEMGTANVRPEASLDGQSSALPECALVGPDARSGLRLQLKLSSHDRQPDYPTGTGKLHAGVPRRTSAESNGKAAKKPQPVQPTEAEVDPASYAALAALTPQEEVIVKDTWNKLLGFHELLMDLFFERLLHEEPELAHRFGDAIDNLAEDFVSLFDTAVRGLQPHTEVILRESYRGVPGQARADRPSVEHFFTLFADVGMRPHHWLTARKVFHWMLGEVPYMEEYERENLKLGDGSAIWKFFTRHLLAPALKSIQDYDAALPPAVIAEMKRGGEVLAANAREVGTDFYRELFQRHPEVLPYFGRTDVDLLAHHLMNSIAFLVRAVSAGDNVLGELRHLAAVHADFGIPPETYPAIAAPMLDIMRRHIPNFSLEVERGWVTLLGRVINVIKQPMVNRGRLLAHAREYLDLIAKELEWDPAVHRRRWEEITNEVASTGTYTQTYEELAYGAQVAWRNSPKCIARIAWRNMIVRDCRHVIDPDDMFREAREHVKMGINGGNMQIVMNVFRPKHPKERWGPRFWNSQYARYAAYEMPDGTILGDKANLGLTKTIQKLGWVPPQPPGPFDILPLVIEVPGRSPKMYEFSPGELVEVPLEHPSVPAFASLGLKWVVIPAIATFRLGLGGLNYACMPFNGWFMGTEIARNLFEPGRYDKSEAIAKVLGLDTSGEQTLWRDRALLELNVAVIYSFAKHKVSLVDHQTASKQFLIHDLREKKAGRETPAQWSWVVPSTGGSSTPVWGHEMRDFFLRPHYHYTADKWAVIGADSTETETHAVSTDARRQRVLILYGSETGTAEGYARQAARRLKAVRPRVLSLDEAEIGKLGEESLVLVVSSTFADGDMPGNAKKFFQRMKELSGRPLDGLNYSVMALGSTVYPHFCAAGAAIDKEFARLGGNRVVALHRGDEIKGQADTFHQWLDLTARLLGEDATAGVSTAGDLRLRVNLVPPNTGPARQGPGVGVRVVANSELLKQVIAGSRSTRFIAFDLTNTGLSYETGDHVAVQPQNPAALVDRVCQLVGVDPAAWFFTSLSDSQGRAAEGETAYPKPLPVRQALTEDLDLSVREPFTELVVAMHRAATDPADKSKLDTWAETLARGDGDESCVTLKKQISDTYMNVADLLQAFPSAKLELAQLVELLPKQKPRLYSISSSSLVHPNQIHVTIGVLQVKTDAGKTRPGLTSNYLASLDPTAGATVRIAVRTSSFRPPEDLNTPVLMVGPGTGLSPLVGFMQDRAYRIEQARKTGKEVIPGNARLYFGCRDQNDYLYQQELEQWHGGGSLTFLGVAFSRLNEKKVYVQNLIAEHAAEIWEVMRHPEARYYVCGDSKMADDVFEALMLAARSQGGLSHAAAVEFFERMKSEKRFFTDVWGVTVNFKQAIKQVQEAKYSQAKQWLDRVTQEVPGSH